MEVCKLKIKDGGDTSINVPGDNVGTDDISPQEGASDRKSDESPVLPSNAPLSGKALQFQQYLEEKNNKKNRKRKKEKKQRKEERKRRNQRKIMTNYFLLQRTGLEICK